VINSSGLDAAARREDTRAFLVGGDMERFFPRGRKARACLGRIVVITSVVGFLSAGCTRFELEDKAGAYSTAISESNNRQILLNAVRASQRAPMSFVGLGEMQASPTFNGNVNGSWNFDHIFGLTTYTLGSTVNAGGGFTGFQLSNLNDKEFMKQMQTPVKDELVQHFIDLDYPEELIKLVFVQKFSIAQADFNKIVHRSAMRCTRPPDQRSIEICDRLAKDHDAAMERGCQEREFIGPIKNILNTAREFCSMYRFQTFVRQLRLLKGALKDISIKGTWRSAEGMLYWLGELIAAQNYSEHPYLPEIYLGTSVGHKLVPLFVVRRGPPIGLAAVLVTYHGEVYYIPQPELGTVDEARSMQVLDLVWYAMTLATSKGDLPKSSTVTLVTAR
jgi:hypothetical protein